MKSTDKKRIQALLKSLCNAHRKCCDLMEDGVFKEGALDICAIDEITSVLEYKLKTETNDEKNNQ